MRIAEINMKHIGSTGKIMFGIAEVAASNGHEVFTFSPKYYIRRKKMDAPIINKHFYFGYRWESMLHYILGEVTGFQGIWSYFGTKQLIRKLRRLKPDILHLHNLHNFTFCLPLLFDYIKKDNIPTIWTLHDCWPMTGKCPYFDIARCSKWKTGCYQCPTLRDYPKAYLDQVKHMWALKRKWFTGISNMTLVTPSEWLMRIVQDSYLSGYPVKVIRNGIDLEIFRPLKDTALYSKYGIPKNKHIVLGVAFAWDKRKGIDVFIDLSKELPDRYKIVLVGTNEDIDLMLPDQIISIHRTQNQTELAELYSLADVFINPTREDNFPTVNLEALACGTPVITFRTGGSPEAIDEDSGICVECDDIGMLKESIFKVCESSAFSMEACVNKATCFSKQNCFQEYIELYEKIFECKKG